MRILLIKPPFSPHHFIPSKGEPLELEYLASAVKEHKVEILDMRCDTKLERKLRTFGPQFVGVTGYTCDANSAKKVLHEVKKYNSNIITAIGGHHATFVPTYFDESYVDVIFLGMADITFKDFINTMENGGDVENVNNIAFRKGDEFFFTAQKDLQANLDLLPLPSRHLTDHYRNYYRDHKRLRTVHVMTNRGCPYRCTFCSCWALMKGKYLTRSPGSIVDELLTLPEDVDLVKFADDNTLHGIRRAWMLSNLIKEKKINKKLSMFARTDTIVKHPDLIENLRDAGLAYVALGLKYIKDEDLDSMKKRVTVQTNNEAIRIIQKLGINTTALFIVNPDFSEEDFQKLYNYVCDMELFHPVFSVLTPLPGSELYKECCDQIINRNFDFFDLIHSVLPTRLERKEFYRQYTRLYSKCYSFRRYFKSVLKDIQLKLGVSTDTVFHNPDRMSFFRMVLLHLFFAIPLYLKSRKVHKSEQLV